MTGSRLRSRRYHPHLLRLSLAAVMAVVVAAALPMTVAAQGTYRNPLLPAIPGDGVVEGCADPTVIYGQEGERLWYMYCTTDPLNDADKVGNDFRFRFIPMFSSPDLVNWTYRGDAFGFRLAGAVTGQGPPAYAAGDAGLWAPEVEYYPETGMYHLYYVVTDTVTTATNPNGPGSAIGVATGPTPLGPWTHRDTPVVEPHAADCCPGSRRWVFDPEVLRTEGADYMYYGSYFGGVSVRVIAESGLTTDPATQTNVAIANKYEGAEILFEGGYYYLLVSATNCCNGPLTGYSVFVGRSTSPTGPFVDKTGVPLNDNEEMGDPTDGRAGGTVFLSMNGNRWVGPGHNTVLQAFDGQWWTIYHAVDRFDPYYEGAVGFTKRPALLDPIDWVNGWPVVRGGFFASDSPMPAPAAQPGEIDSYRPVFRSIDRRAALLPEFSDQFNDPVSLKAKWTWVRSPATGSYAIGGGTFRLDTQAADLHESSNNASVLLQTTAAPREYMVETKVRLTVPREGCCFNFVQAGLVIYGNDDNYIKFVHVSIFNTRQTEFAKEVPPGRLDVGGRLEPVPAGYPRYGNTVVGPPGEWTYLRIVKRIVGAEEEYTAYSSRDRRTWERGGTWTHALGADARIGLVSMGGSGFQAYFDYVRVYRLHRWGGGIAPGRSWRPGLR
jgi:arabinan endo-1,5-alpha-L-arabinosidase